MAGVRRGAFTCVGWLVTLCDPIWQVTSRSSEAGNPLEELYRSLLLTFTNCELPISRPSTCTSEQRGQHESSVECSVLKTHMVQIIHLLRCSVPV